MSFLRGDKPDKPEKVIDIPQADEEEAALIAQVQSDYEDAKSARQKHADRWQTIHEYFVGDQWNAPEDDDDEWMPRPVTNIVENFIDNAHANITSSKVAITITERRPGYAEVAKRLQDVILSTWDGLDMNAKLRNEAEYIRPEVGTVVFKSPWNPKRNNGKGDIDCYVVHPMNVLFDPNISNPRDIQQSDFMDFVMPKTKSYILRRYSKEQDKSCRFTREELDALLQGESAADVEYEGENDYTSERQKVLLHEYWYRDDNGKLQVAWLANWRVLKTSTDDKKMAKNGFYKHGKYPVVIAQYKPRPKCLYGRSEVESLISFTEGRTDGIQDCINKLDQKVLVGASLASIGQWVYRHGKVKEPEKLSAEAGLKVPVKESVTEDVARLKGPEVPQFIMLWRDKKIEDAQRVTSQWDVSRGEPVSGRRTASEALARREQALKPQNDRVETLNDALSELIQLWIEHLAEFGVERDYEIATPEGPRVFSFDPKKELFPEGKPKADVDIGEDDTASRRIQFNVRVDVGANLVLTKAYMYELGFALWDRMAITPDAFYALLPDFPGKSESLQTIKAIWQQRMMQQQPQPQPGIQAEQQAAEEQQTGQDLFHQEIAVFIDSLPPEVQQQLAQLPEEQKEQAIAQLFIQAKQQQQMGAVA
jgi:hypothetical protein